MIASSKDKGAMYQALQATKLRPTRILRVKLFIHKGPRLKQDSILKLSSRSEKVGWRGQCTGKES